MTVISPETTESSQNHPELSVRVAAKETAAAGVVALSLTSTDGTALPRWTPGAHIDVILPNGLTRQYSLAGDPAQEDQWLIAVLKEPQSRGGSAYIHEQLAEGDTLQVRGPRNNFRLSDQTAGYLFIAGGIGITPILPMIREVSAAGAPWQLVYGGRSRTTMAFLDVLMQHGDNVTVVAEDTHGYPDLQGILQAVTPGTHVYSCGPEGLLSAVNAAAAHLPPSALHSERFVAAPIDNSDNNSFEIVLEGAGITAIVPPDKSVLEVIRETGVEVLSSCEEGTCGSCETVVLQGEPDHRCSVLTPEERASCSSMMICVSRARSPQLVLEL